MKNLIMVTAVSVLFVFGCSNGGSDGGPAAPEEPTIDGVWTGTSMTTSISPASHPVVALMVAYLNQPYAITASFSTANGVSCTLTSTDSGAYELLSGSFSGSTFALSGTYSSVAVLTGIEADGVLYDLYLHTSSFSGTMSGDSITGTWGSSYNVTYSASGDAAGVITTSDRVTLARGK